MTTTSSAPLKEAATDWGTASIMETRALKKHQDLNCCLTNLSRSKFYSLLSDNLIIYSWWMDSKEPFLPKLNSPRLECCL